MENSLYDLIKGELNWVKWYLSCNQSNQDQCPCSSSPTAKKKKSVSMVPSWVSAQASCLHCATLSGWWFKLFTRQWPDAIPTKKHWFDRIFCNAMLSAYMLKTVQRIGLNQFIDWKQNLMQTFQVMLPQDRYITMVPSENRREIWNEVLLGQMLVAHLWWIGLTPSQIHEKFSLHTCFKPLHVHPWKRHKLCTSGEAKLF